MLFRSFTRYASLASDTAVLLDTLDQELMHGQMSANMRQSVQTAVNAVPAANTAQRAKTAIYLIATSSQYQVEH